MSPPMPVSMLASHVLSFGPFLLVLPQRVLMRSGVRVRIGSRALEILVALLEKPGDLVTKDVLTRRIWPTVLVEEGTLRVHIAGLRKALHDGDGKAAYVESVIGHGYRFVAPVVRDALPAFATGMRRPEAKCAPSLPVPLTTMLGRREIVSSVCEQLSERRFISLVGPGGSGKTTVAVAIANELCPVYGNSVEFIDLAALDDPIQVMPAIATRLGLPRNTSTLADICKQIEFKHMLVVLDNCEHLLQSAATAAEGLLRGADKLHILATSREPLRADGEWVQRVRPLALPPVGARLSAAGALDFAAIRLFDQRVRAAHVGWELRDEDVSPITEICQRLDGLPLAIELAAAHVPILGLQALIRAGDHLFQLLTNGLRTAAPRQQTLSATLAWSFATLSGTEQLVLCRLASLPRVFDADAAVGAAACDGRFSCVELLEALARLVAKSLLHADASSGRAQYRMLETVRAFARLHASSPCKSAAPAANQRKHTTQSGCSPSPLRYCG